MEEAKPDNQNTVLTRHAVKRFLERCAVPMSEEQAQGAIFEMLAKAKSVELKKEFRALQLMNHNYQEATYHRFSDWMFVIVEGVMVTCYRGENHRWHEPKK
jgi:hypothetical protein